MVLIKITKGQLVCTKVALMYDNTLACICKIPSKNISLISCPQSFSFGNLDLTLLNNNVVFQCNE